jgi:hypothetical protein
MVDLHFTGRAPRDGRSRLPRADGHCDLLSTVDPRGANATLY